MRASKTLVAASILSADFGRMADETAAMEKSGVDLIHCDVMDGIFVPNITFGFKMITDIKKRTSLPLDVHLMIDRPSRYIEKAVDSGADFLTVHYEAGEDPRYALETIKKLGAKSGLSISPDTDTSVVKEYIELCDLVLLMSVYPGFGGQKFIPKSLDRMSSLKKMRELSGLNTLLSIDGGVNENNAAEIVGAGADVLVTGNTLFSAKNPSEIVAKFHNL